jgi:hypothetical protein
MDIMRKGALNFIKAINIRFIPHKEQRYPTVGDWFFRYTTLHIRTSIMDKEEYEILVAVHELVEAFLCRRAGVREEDVTAFDIKFEDERAQGLHGPTDEPGDDRAAPYYTQHQIATHVERFLCKALSIDWEEYDAAVNSL